MPYDVLLGPACWGHISSAVEGCHTTDAMPEVVTPRSTEKQSEWEHAHDHSAADCVCSCFCSLLAALYLPFKIVATTESCDQVSKRTRSDGCRALSERALPRLDHW